MLTEEQRSQLHQEALSHYRDGRWIDLPWDAGSLETMAWRSGHDFCHWDHLARVDQARALTDDIAGCLVCMVISSERLGVSVPPNIVERIHELVDLAKKEGRYRAPERYREPTEIEARAKQQGDQSNDARHRETDAAPVKDAQGGTDMSTVQIEQVQLDANGNPIKKGPISGKWKEMGVSHGGEKIVLPVGMTDDEAIAWLVRHKEAEERVVAVEEIIDGFPMDAGIAVLKALQRVKGFVSLAATPTWFGDVPPKMITIESGVGQTTQVPWGRIQIPGIDGWIHTSMEVRDGLRVVLKIVGQVKQKHRDDVANLMAVAREILRTESIYKGKAIRIRFPKNEEEIDPSYAPKFMDTSKTSVHELIFPLLTARQVEVSVLTPIRHTDRCRKLGIPLKRGVLLEGPYGTGKTLTAAVTARVCEENGWSFVYLEDVSQLQQAILFARQYSPAVIFAEDIDRVVSGGRSGEMDKILNTIDGVDTKNSDIMVVLTTNHVENINRAMLRPGRLDAVISVRPPDAQAAERLVRLYARQLVDEDTDLRTVGERLAGQIPAVIKEVVERSKLAAIAHASNGHLSLTAEDLLTAADGMIAHLELLSEKKDQVETDAEAFGRCFGDALANALTTFGDHRSEVKEERKDRATMPA